MAELSNTIINGALRINGNLKIASSVLVDKLNADMVDGIHGTILVKQHTIAQQVSAGLDWNTFIEPGSYKVQGVSGAPATNSPLVAFANVYPYGILEVLRGAIDDTSEKRILQIYYPHDFPTNGEVGIHSNPCYRWHNGDDYSTHWNAWSKIAPSTIGALSINGGTIIPTNADESANQGIRISRKQNPGSGWSLISLGTDTTNRGMIDGQFLIGTPPLGANANLSKRLIVAGTGSNTNTGERCASFGANGEIYDNGNRVYSASNPPKELDIYVNEINIANGFNNADGVVHLNHRGATKQIKKVLFKNGMANEVLCDIGVKDITAKNITTTGLTTRGELQLSGTNKIIYQNNQEYTFYDNARRDYYTTSRDFANGTFVKTDLDYRAVTPESGASFLLEIVGNNYMNDYPVDIKLQGYIYNSSIIVGKGISNGTLITGITAFSFEDKLCFWWPRQGYWIGYSILCRDVLTNNNSNINHVIDVLDELKPTAIKGEVSFDIAEGVNTRSNQIIDGTKTFRNAITVRSNNTIYPYTELQSSGLDFIQNDRRLHLAVEPAGAPGGTTMVTIPYKPGTLALVDDVDSRSINGATTGAPTYTSTTTTTPITFTRTTGGNISINVTTQNGITTSSGLQTVKLGAGGLAWSTSAPYTIRIPKETHGRGNTQDLQVTFLTNNGGALQGTYADYQINNDYSITVTADNKFDGKALISSSLAPNSTASWGNISGNIGTQTDLVDYVKNNSGGAYLKPIFKLGDNLSGATLVFNKGASYNNGSFSAMTTLLRSSTGCRIDVGGPPDVILYDNTSSSGHTLYRHFVGWQVDSIVLPSDFGTISLIEPAFNNIILTTTANVDTQKVDTSRFYERTNIASPETTGIVRVGGTTNTTDDYDSICIYQSSSEPVNNGRLFARKQIKSNPNYGIYLNYNTPYIVDSAYNIVNWSNNSIYGFGTDYTDYSNYTTTSNFDTVYLYCNSYHSYPKVLKWSVTINSTSYSYNIIPINSSSSTVTRSYHYRSPSWTNFPAFSVGDKIVYTCIAKSSTEFMWSRELYKHQQ